jgi:hypothetical protein
VTRETPAVRIALSGCLVLALALVPVALANNGHGGGGASTARSSALSLTSETVQLNPNTPSWCLGEDDYDRRVFAGSLSGSYSTSYRMCDLNTDGFTAGGIGLESDVYVVGQVSDLTITSPDGGVHHAVLMGQTTSKGVTSYRYAVCYVPLYYLSTDIGTDPLRGGTWQITLSGQISNANWTTRAQMTDTVFQQSYCPPSQQNLSP